MEAPLLHQLPNELIEPILSELDFPSLLAVRAVNRASARSIHGLRAYQMLLLHAGDLITVMMAARIASDCSLNQLFSLLQSPGCHLCNRFAPAVWLFNVARVCASCTLSSSRMTAVPMRWARSLTDSGLVTAKDTYAFRQQLDTLRFLPWLPGLDDGGEAPERDDKYVAIADVYALVTGETAGSDLDVMRIFGQRSNSTFGRVEACMPCSVYNARTDTAWTSRDE